MYKKRNVLALLVEILLYIIISLLAIKNTEINKITPIQQLFFYVGVAFLFIHYRLSFIVFKNLFKDYIQSNKAIFYVLILIVASLFAQSKFHYIVTTWVHFPEEGLDGYIRPNEYGYWVGEFNYVVLILTYLAYLLAKYVNEGTFNNTSLTYKNLSYITVIAHLFVVFTYLFCVTGIFYNTEIYAKYWLPHKILNVSLFYLSCVLLHYYKRLISSYVFFIPFLIIPIILESYFISSKMITISSMFMPVVIAPYYLFIFDIFSGNVNLSYGASKEIYMRRQLSSHYFLNSMNTIYSYMLLEENKKATRLMVKFIEQMKYVTYEADEMEIELSQEIDFIKGYIEIMKERFVNDDTTTLEIKFPDELPEKKIPPLLLLPPVENMFKHGISKVKDTHLKLNIFIEGKWLVLVTENTKNNKNQDENHKGKGLSTLRSYLRFMYPSRHNLKLEDKDDIFYLYLRIKL